MKRFAYTIAGCAAGLIIGLGLAFAGQALQGLLSTLSCVKD